MGSSFGARLVSMAHPERYTIHKHKNKKYRPMKDLYYIRDLFGSTYQPLRTHLTKEEAEALVKLLETSDEV